MFNKKHKESKLRSKYLDYDIENMSDAEFDKISKQVYMSVVIRGVGGMLLFIMCMVSLILCGRYLW